MTWRWQGPKRTVRARPEKDDGPGSNGGRDIGEPGIVGDNEASAGGKFRGLEQRESAGEVADVGARKSAGADSAAERSHEVPTTATSGKCSARRGNQGQRLAAISPVLLPGARSDGRRLGLVVKNRADG